MINTDFLQELLIKPTPEDLNVYKRMGLDSYTSPTGARYPTADYFNPPKTSSINRDFVDSLALDEHPEVTESKLPPMADPDQPLTHFADPVPPTGIPDIADPQGITGDRKPPFVREDPVRAIKQIKGLARGAENVIGTVGSMAQWVAERATIGNILTRHTDLPYGAGVVAEYLVRKFGPKKPMEFFDKQMTKYAKQGEKWADYWEEQSQKGWEAPDPEVTQAKWRDMPITKGIATISEAAPNYLAAIASSVLTKSPQTGLLFISALSGAGAYRRQRKAGAGVAKANAIATLTGAWEYITEKIPFDEVFKPAKSTFLKMLKLGTLESAQEFVQGIGENFLEYFGYKAKDLNSVPAAVKEGLEHTMDGWVENVVAGGGLGVIGGGIVPKGGLIKAAPPPTEVIPAPQPPSKPITPEIPPVTPTESKYGGIPFPSEEPGKISLKEAFERKRQKAEIPPVTPTVAKAEPAKKKPIERTEAETKALPIDDQINLIMGDVAGKLKGKEQIDLTKLNTMLKRAKSGAFPFENKQYQKQIVSQLENSKLWAEKHNKIFKEAEPTKVVGEIPVLDTQLTETQAKISLRQSPTTFRNLGDRVINVKGHPGIYTDGRLMLLDRKTQEVNSWKEQIKKKVPSYEWQGREVTYEAVKETLPELKETKLLSEPIAYQIEGKQIAPKALFDIGQSEALAINAEAYKWLKKQGYDFQYTDLQGPILLTKVGKSVGVIMPTRSGIDVKELAQVVGEKLKAEQVKPKGKRVISEESYQKAKKRLTDRTTLRMGVEPQGFADLVTIGAYHIENGLRTFAAWSRKMIDVYGESVKPQLKKIWAQVRPLSAEEVEAFPKEFLTEQQRTKAEMGEIPSEGEYKSQSETFNVHLDYFQKRQLPKTSRIPKIQARIRTINGQRLAGKVSAKAANKAIIALREHLIETAIDEGIALRMTRGGKISLSVRKAGTYVPEEFAQNEFKNIRPILGGGQDITRAIQQMDGSLSLKGKLREKGQAGPLERHVLWPTRDISIQKLNYIKEKTAELKSIFKTKKGTKEDEQINRILEQIAKEDRATPIKDILSRKTLRAIANSKVIQQAIQLREFYDNLIEEQNLAREMRDQDTIPYRHNYSPHILRDATIWERLMMTGKKPKDIKADLPDYIKPNAPFNPRAMAREAGIPYEERVKSAQELAESYLATASQDIFNTSIIQNNKAFIQQLESMGYDKSANYLADWTAEAYAGIKPRLDRAIQIGRKAEKSARYFNRLRNMAVFPLNISWSLLTQTSSLALTVGRYGTTNTMMGFVQWLNPKIRKQAAEDYYSYIVKSEKQGRITRQDAQNLIGQRVKLRRTSTEIARDISTLLLDQLEKLLTGTSIRAAHLHGKKRGLTGEALRNYASDGGAKTQSMYNDEDKPALLRNLLIKTGLPYQTFSFEVVNTMREWAGRTGTPPDSKLYTIWTIIRFLAAAAVFSAIGKKWGNKEIWSWKRPPIPFAELWLSPIIRRFNNEYIGVSGSGLISPVETAQRVAKGIDDVLETGSWRKLRNELTKYGPGIFGVPGGVQISRTVDAIIAYAQGGVKDRKGRLLFEMEDPQDLAQAIFSGVWSTEGGRAYLDIDYRIKNMTPKELRQFRKDNVYQKTRVVKLKDGTKVKQKKDQPHKGREKLVEKIDRELEKRE